MNRTSTSRYIAPQAYLSLTEDAMARRRGQRTGYVYRRGDSWFGQYRVDTAELDSAGRFRRQKITKFIAPAAGAGKVTKKRALAIFYEEHLKDLHRVGPLSSKTVQQFTDEVFRPQVVLACKDGGQAHYDYVLRVHILPALGEFTMRDVGPQQVYNLIRAKLDKGLSVQTVTHIRNTLSTLFRHAKRMRAYSGDLPTEGVRLPVLTHKERRALTWNQVQAIAAVIGYPEGERSKYDRHSDPEATNLQLGALVRVLALTGLRIGEAMGLRWKHVDLDAGVLHVRENYVRGKYGTLKTDRSKRDVPLHSLAIAELRKLQSSYGLPGQFPVRRREVISRMEPGPADDGRSVLVGDFRGDGFQDETHTQDPELPVFSGRESGKPLDQHNVAARFLRPAGKRAGVPWVSWHTFRVTAATLADQVGLSVAERQKILGHATAVMALHYTKPEAEQIRGRIEQIGKEKVN